MTYLLSRPSKTGRMCSSMKTFLSSRCVGVLVVVSTSHGVTNVVKEQVVWAVVHCSEEDFVYVVG